MSSGHASLKCRSGNRKFWAEACCASAVGLNGAAIVECIRQGQTGICLDRPSVREYEDSSKNQPGGLSGGHAAGQAAIGLERSEGQGAWASGLRFLGLCPKDRRSAVWAAIIAGDGQGSIINHCRYRSEGSLPCPDSHATLCAEADPLLFLLPP